MNFNQPNRKNCNRPIKSELHELYPKGLQLYKEPPVCNITSAEFGECTAEILKGIDSILT